VKHRLGLGRVKKLDIINQKVINLINKWKPYKLSVHERVTTDKAILISHYTYIVTILDVVGEEEISKIQNLINKG